MKFGFVGPSYTAQSNAVDDEECINWYAESIESPGAQTRWSYFGTPGLKSFATFDDGPARGQCWTGDRLFVASADTLYEVFADGTTIKRMAGTLDTFGGPVSIAFSSIELLIVAGGRAYCYELAGNTFQDVTAKLAGGPVKVKYSDGYFIVIFGGSNKFQISAILDGTTWPGIQVNAVSVFAENIVSIEVSHRELWVFGNQHAQPYQDTGTDEIFDVIPGALIETGGAATFGVDLVDNTVFWISQDIRGSRQAWRANGYTPQRISTHAVETALSSYSADQIANLVSYSYQDRGHLFWVLYIPNTDCTWVYDVAQSLWHKRASWDSQEIGTPDVQYPNPPFALPPGQSVAWAIATEHTGPVSFQNHDAFGNSGAASSTLTTGTLSLSGGSPIDANSVTQGWSNFVLSINLPPGATITAVKAAVFVSSIAPGGNMNLAALPSGEHLFGDGGFGIVEGWNIGTADNLGTLAGQSISAFIQNTLDGGTAQLNLTISFVGMAVYYTDPANPAGGITTTLIPGTVVHAPTFTYGPHRSWNHVYAFGKHLVGDWETGTLWDMSLNYYDDNGAPIRRLRRAPTLVDEMEWVYYKELTLDFATGLPQPQLLDGNGNPRPPQAMLRWSDNRGFTWSNQHILNCGFAGQYNMRVIARRLGRSRYRVFEVSVTDAVPWTLVDAYLRPA